MKRNYKLAHKLIASIVLLSLCLQSCGNFSNQLSPKIEKTSDDIPRTSKQIDIKPLAGQTFTAEKDYLITFHEHNGALKADLRVDHKQKMLNYRNLDVAIDQGADLAELPHLSRQTQQRRIQLERPQTGLPTRVYIFKGGLSGGMRRKREHNQQKEGQYDRYEKRGKRNKLKKM